MSDPQQPASVSTVDDHVKLMIGDLVLTVARLTVDVQILRAALASAQALVAAQTSTEKNP